MSDEEETPQKPEAPPARQGLVGLLMGAVFPALLAGGAAFGAVRFSRPAAAHEAAAPEPKPPGPTLQLEPFLVTIPDASKRSHAMKVTLAVELDPKSKEETLKSYLPRIRDAFLTHLRTETYEAALDQAHAEKLKGELVVCAREAGVTNVERVLITDFVVQ